MPYLTKKVTTKDAKNAKGRNESPQPIFMGVIQSEASATQAEGLKQASLAACRA
jgi:hypothetical protein